MISSESAGPEKLEVTPEDAGKRLDVFLTKHLPAVSRARVQQLIAQQKVLVEGQSCRPSRKLRSGEQVRLLGAVERLPLKAVPEDIPLDVVYEDDDLAVINKPAGMMVHAGAGAAEEARNRGTLVNALLHRFGALSTVGGDLRPGIVHRLDKQTSGLMVVAKNDAAHRHLAGQFASRRVRKTYLALVHGWPKQDEGVVESAISRDRLRRTRMTTRRRGGRAALSRYRVRERIQSQSGRFALLEVSIATGRTHQIRVHLASLGHPVVGDTLYGAPRTLRASGPTGEIATLPRNFLHSAAIELTHPASSKLLSFSRPLPPDLEDFLSRLRAAGG